METDYLLFTKPTKSVFSLKDNFIHFVTNQPVGFHLAAGHIYPQQ